MFQVALRSIVVVGLVLFLGSCSSETPALTVNTSLSAGRSTQASRDCTRFTCVGGPQVMTVKLYKAYVSLSTSCSNPILVTDNGSTGRVVSLGVDSLISASPAAATYQCLILDMSDILSFIPDSAAAAAFPGVCSTSSTSSFDIYRTDSGDSGLWKDINGAAITATGSGTTAGENRIVIWGSTDVAALTGAGIHINQTLDLSGALVVPGQTTFFADFSNGITDDGGLCKIEGGTGMGFR